MVHVYRDASKTRWWNPPEKKSVLPSEACLGGVDLQSSISSIKIGLDKCHAVMPSSVRFLSVSRGGCDAQKNPSKKTCNHRVVIKKNGSDLQSQVGFFSGKPPVNTKNLIQNSRILQ